MELDTSTARVDLIGLRIDLELIALIPAEIALRLCILPVAKADRVIVVAVLPEPASLEIPRLLKEALAIESIAINANEEELRPLVEEHYG